MASIWRIDGVFWTCALKKRGQVFTRVGLLVNLYSVVVASEVGEKNCRVVLNKLPPPTAHT